MTQGGHDVRRAQQVFADDWADLVVRADGGNTTSRDVFLMEAGLLLIITPSAPVIRAR